MLLSSLAGVWAFNSPYFYELEIAGMDEGLMRVSTTFIIGCIVAAFLLKDYNGDRGKQMKWFFYIFYPLHLAVIGGIALALGLVDLSAFQVIMP